MYKENPLKDLSKNDIPTLPRINTQQVRKGLNKTLFVRKDFTNIEFAFLLRDCVRIQVAGTFKRQLSFHKRHFQQLN